MLKFDRQELIPVVIQDDESNEVLMVAFMNEEAFRRTRETGYTHLYSRSRQTLWRKGEESGNVQEVRALFVNCEENSLLLRVVQHGDAACHEGYKSCYFRRLQPDGSYQTIAERVFDPTLVYAKAKVPSNSQNKEHQTPMPEITERSGDELRQRLETELRQLYGVYLYLRDNDLSTESNTSRLLQDHSHTYLLARLADELQELAGVQSGEHVHTGREEDTTLEGSQVGYWLFLLAATHNVAFNDIAPHLALLKGYTGHYSEDGAVELRQECLNRLSQPQQEDIVQGLQLGFTFIGWACNAAGINPLAPTEYDLAQMRRKGLVQ